MSTGSRERSTAGVPAHLLLISAPDCHFCAQAREILERLGCDYPLRVEERSLTSPEGQEMALRHGILFPPGIVLDGTFVGFGRPSERKLRRLLEHRAHAATTTTPGQSEA